LGVTGLVSSQTAVKCGHGFGDHSQDGQLARWGLGRDTKWRSCYAQKRLRNAKQGNHLKNFTRSVLGKQNLTAKDDIVNHKTPPASNNLISQSYRKIDASSRSY